MSEEKEGKPRLAKLWQGSTRLYLIVAAVLVVIIVIAAVLLITQGLPARRQSEEPTAMAQEPVTTTPVPTFTPGPTHPPTDTPLPAASPTMAPPIMQDTDNPTFALQSAGARPSADWTGFFGQVVAADGEPLAGVPIIVWYSDGTPASEVTWTDSDGSFEIRLAEAAFAGTWSIQVLTPEGQPASKLFTFETDANAETGFQQVQVIWQKLS